MGSGYWLDVISKLEEKKSKYSECASLINELIPSIDSYKDSVLRASFVLKEKVVIHGTSVDNGELASFAGLVGSVSLAFSIASSECLTKIKECDTQIADAKANYATALAAEAAAAEAAKEAATEEES